MDDFKIILYILAAVAYFLFTQWRKAFSSPEEQEELPPPKNRRVDQDYPTRPVTSFEDILRELQPKAEKGKAVIEAAREEVKENVPPLAPVMTAKETKFKNYADTPPKALSWEKRAEAIEAAKRSQEMRQPLLKANEQEKSQKSTSRYATLLRNPATVRDAVILSEIFNRKYS